jgi:hypothetical protein
MEKYWDKVRERVCRKCIDGDGKGNCRLPVGETCALHVFFPEIVETIEGARGTSYDDYVVALRQNICKNCEHQLTDGSCFKRNALECALDRYYPLLVTIIEELIAEHHERMT